jgi:hypothetical protein
MTDKTLAEKLEAAMNAGEKTMVLDTRTVALMIQNARDARTTIDALTDDLAEGVSAARAVVESWEKGDLAGAVNMLDGWVDEMVEAHPDMGPLEDGDDEDAEADEEEAAMRERGVTPEAFAETAADLTCFIFTYGDADVIQIRDHAAQRYATLESIRAEPGMRRASIAEVKVVDADQGLYDVVKVHPRH